MQIGLSKKFSIAHFDSWSDANAYYDVIKNSAPRFRDEIYDIYFGKMFRYKYQEQEPWDGYRKSHEINYGNVMGVEATDAQVENLFKIQNESGVEISLTLNQLNIPVEMFYAKNGRVIGAFIEWLRTFYDRGLRSCTLANNHLMRSGLLQKYFPGMKWKNTVNQQVSNAQQVLDYLYLGYNVIQLDRSLNRNLNELKRVKEAVENYKAAFPKKYVKTCLLVWEDCLPQCPFKREHDDLQVYHKKIDYWSSDLGAMTCTKWRDEASGRSFLPRCGTNCYWVTPGSFEEYADLVDIFKFSGRLTGFTALEGDGPLQYGWSAGNNAVSSFSEILENDLQPIHLWKLGAFRIAPFERDVDRIKADLSGNIWLTDAGRQLEDRLKNCRNLCYTCHLCERTFGVSDFNSLMEF
jgi:hypothetical protein